MLRDCRPKMSDWNKNQTSYGTPLYYTLLHDNGHQVPNKAARPPPSTTRAMAPRTLSLQDDRGKPVIPTSPPAALRDGRAPFDDPSSLFVTSTRYTLPNCSRGTAIDGRRSMRTTGRRSAANRSETATRAPPPPPWDSAFWGSTSRRIRALHSPSPSDVVFGRGDEGWFARM